jgi:hypothetical protein
LGFCPEAEAHFGFESSASSLGLDDRN